MSWLKNSNWNEIQKELEKAVPGIECEECGTGQHVCFIELGKSSTFLCIDCIRKLKDEEFAEPSSTGNLRTRFLVLQRDGFKCVYCGRSPSDGTVLEVDHVHPRSKGGSDELHNLVTACWECNRGKGDLLLNDRQLNKPRG
jgi:hypothetical protein